MSRSIASSACRAAAFAVTALALSGCITPAPSISLKVRANAQPVDSVFAFVKADEIPQPFVDSFLSNLQVALTAHGVKARARRISDLDLDGVPAAVLAPYHYVLGCKPSATLRNQYVLMSVTMNCVLTDTRTQARVMSSDVWVGKSTHFGDVGALEARRAAFELVDRMQGIALVGPALEALDPTGRQPSALPTGASASRAASSLLAVAAGANSGAGSFVAPARSVPAPLASVPPVPVSPVGATYAPAPPRVALAPPAEVAALPQSTAGRGPTPSSPTQPPTNDRVIYLKVLPNRTVQEVHEHDY